MAALTTITIPVATGLDDLAGSLVAAASLGDTAETGSGLVFVALNGDASSKTLTIATPKTFHGLAIPEVQMTVEAGDIALLPLSRELFRGTGGRAAITYSAITSLTVGVFRLGT